MGFLSASFDELRQMIGRRAPGSRDWRAVQVFIAGTAASYVAARFLTDPANEAVLQSAPFVMGVGLTLVTAGLVVPHRGVLRLTGSSVLLIVGMAVLASRLLPTHLPDRTVVVAVAPFTEVTPNAHGAATDLTAALLYDLNRARLQGMRVRILQVEDHARSPRAHLLVTGSIFAAFGRLQVAQKVQVLTTQSGFVAGPADTATIDSTQYPFAGLTEQKVVEAIAQRLVGTVADTCGFAAYRRRDFNGALSYFGFVSSAARRHYALGRMYFERALTSDRSDLSQLFEHALREYEAATAGAPLTPTSEVSRRLAFLEHATALRDSAGLLPLERARAQVDDAIGEYAMVRRLFASSDPVWSAILIDEGIAHTYKAVLVPTSMRENELSLAQKNYQTVLNTHPPPEYHYLRSEALALLAEVFFERFTVSGSFSNLVDALESSKAALTECDVEQPPGSAPWWRYFTWHKCALSPRVWASAQRTLGVASAALGREESVSASCRRLLEQSIRAHRAAARVYERGNYTERTLINRHDLGVAYAQLARVESGKRKRLLSKEAIGILRAVVASAPPGPTWSQERAERNLAQALEDAAETAAPEEQRKLLSDAAALRKRASQGTDPTERPPGEKPRGRSRQPN